MFTSVNITALVFTILPFLVPAASSSVTNPNILNWYEVIEQKYLSRFTLLSCVTQHVWACCYLSIIDTRCRFIVVSIWKGLKKPNWRPPNGVFPIVWTFLYSSMGFASYLIYRDGGGLDGPARIPLILYAVQLVLNWLWPFVFFVAHSLKWVLKYLRLILLKLFYNFQIYLQGFYEIALMAISIAACAYSFRPINETAFYLMLPYLAWVSFATLVNYSIWQMNNSSKKMKK